MAFLRDNFGKYSNTVSKGMFDLKIAVLLVFLIFLFAVPAQGRYSGGDGEPSTPYRIGTAEDLNDIANHPNDFSAYFVMVNDINLADYTGTQFNIIGYYEAWQSPNNVPFTGVFDGNGHIISNFTYHTSGEYAIGLFGFVDDVNAVIRNLQLRNCDVNSVSGYDVGSLVGYNKQGMVSNCSATGVVSGNGSIGVLVGRNGCDSLLGIIDCGGTIHNCWASGEVFAEMGSVGGLVGTNHGTILDSSATVYVSRDDYAGGLVGVNSYHFIGQPPSTISGCYAVTTVDGNECTGGLAGSNGGVISDCYAKGIVSGTNRVGGLVGRNMQHIHKCYAIVNVSGESKTGGLVGYSSGAAMAMISDCYAMGTVDGNNSTGGLAGWVDGMHSRVWHCCATGEVDGNDNTGGFIGESSRTFMTMFTYSNCFWDSDVNPDINGIGNTTDPNVIGKTTAEMKKESTFTDWDFIEIWDICEGTNYPRLVWSIPQGDLLCPDGVDFIDYSYFANCWDMNDPNCDFDESGYIDANDLKLFGDDWLRNY